MSNKIVIKENAALREKYYLIEHHSGLRIYVFPKAMSTCYALFATKYGAIDNCFRPEWESAWTAVPDGIAHFLEHKLFETEDGTETDLRFAAIGASSNAFTSSDMTAYEFSCTDHVYEALEILLDFVTHPYFTDENVKKEQGIIGQEIDMCEDIPTRRIYYELLNALYAHNPTRINVCGTQESIADITPQYLYTCYHTFYHPSNMMLVVCGEVDLSKVEALVDSYVKPLPKREIKRYFKAEPKNIVSNRRALHMEVARPLFAIGVKDVSPVIGTPDAVRRGLIFGLISEWIFGTSSAFYERLYDEGLLNSRFSAGYENYRTCAFFLLTGEASDPEVIYEHVLEEFNRVCSTPPAQEDFLRVRKAMYAEYVRDFDSTEDIANNLLTYAMMEADLLDVGEVINGITYEETIEAMRELFCKERFAMATVLPKRDSAET